MTATPDRPDDANANALLAMAVGTIGGRRGRAERTASMILMPILRATPDLASARAALDAAEVSDRDRGYARTLLDSILASRDDPRVHPRAK
jgi:hypothetical protein